MVATGVSNLLQSGLHTIATYCREVDGDVDFVDSSIAYVQLNDT